MDRRARFAKGAERWDAAADAWSAAAFTAESESCVDGFRAETCALLRVEAAKCRAYSQENRARAWECRVLAKGAA